MSATTDYPTIMELKNIVIPGIQRFKLAISPQVSGIGKPSYTAFCHSQHIMIVFSHGGNDGSICDKDRILSQLALANFLGYRLIIACCFPCHVKSKNPDLAPYVYGDWDDYSCSARTNTTFDKKNDTVYIEDFAIGRSVEVRDYIAELEAQNK